MYFHRNVPGPSTSVSPPGNYSALRPSVQIHQQSSLGQANPLGWFYCWNFQASSGGSPASDLTTRQDGHAEIEWHSSTMSGPYPNIPSNSPRSPEDDALSLLGDQLQVFNHDMAIPWDMSASDPGNLNLDIDVMSVSDSQIGSPPGRFDSMALSNPSTMASSISESFILPGSSSGVDSPGGTNQLLDLSLPGMCDEHFKIFLTSNFPSLCATESYVPKDG